MSHVDTKRCGLIWTILQRTHPRDYSSTKDRSYGVALVTYSCVTSHPKVQWLRKQPFFICHEFEFVGQEFGQGCAENSSVLCGVARGPWLYAAGGWAGLLTCWDVAGRLGSARTIDQSACKSLCQHSDLRRVRLLSWWLGFPRERSKRSWWQLQGFLRPRPRTPRVSLLPHSASPGSRGEERDSSSAGS